MHRHHRLRACLLGGATIFASVAFLAQLALGTHQLGDYVPGGPVSGDNAAPAIAALLHGSFASYAAHQPVIGLTSLLLRVPFAALADRLGGQPLLGYQLGALGCLLPLAGLTAWLVTALPWRAGLPAALVLILSPVLGAALTAGHPETALDAVLVCAAVLAASRGRASWAAVALGLAIGTKEWALIAIPPVFVALPASDRRRAALLAGGLGAVLTGIGPLADPAAFLRTVEAEGANHTVNQLSLWWPFGRPVQLPGGVLSPDRVLPFGLTRIAASLLALAGAAVPLTLRWRRAGAGARVTDPLAMLALLGVIRCLCDTTHLEYYYMAALVPLVVWEAAGLRRPPVLSGLATAAVVSIPFATELLAAPVVNVLSTCATVALAVHLACRAVPVAPGHKSSVGVPGLALAQQRQSAE